MTKKTYLAVIVSTEKMTQMPTTFEGLRALDGACVYTVKAGTYTEALALAKGLFFDSDWCRDGSTYKLVEVKENTK